MNTRDTSRRPRALVAFVATLAILLSGCAVRLETPPQPSPTPDVNESARRAASSAETSVVTIANELSTRADLPSAPWQEFLAGIVADGNLHLGSLGADAVDDPPTSAASPSSEVTGTAELLTQLTGALQSAREVDSSEAPTVSNPDLARLLVSLTSYYDVVLWQAASLGGESPDLPPLPDAIDAPTAWVTVATAADELGYTYEVAAAHVTDAARTEALTNAEANRSYGQQWAERLGVAGNDGDTRLAVYPPPLDPTTGQPIALADGAALTAAEIVLFPRLAEVFGSLNDGTDPTMYPTVAAGVTSATIAALALGVPIPAFPGLGA